MAKTSLFCLSLNQCFSIFPTVAYNLALCMPQLPLTLTQSPSGPFINPAMSVQQPQHLLPWGKTYKCIFSCHLMQFSSWQQGEEPAPSATNLFGDLSLKKSTKHTADMLTP